MPKETLYTMTPSLFLFLVACLCCAAGYNLDTHSATLFESPSSWSARPSYFGFSVALHTDRRRNASTLLVGAPRANSTNPRKRRIVEPGAVLLCPVPAQAGADDRPNCSEWLELDGDRPAGPGSMYPAKRDHAWLGASIQVGSLAMPKIAVCAPRWQQDWGYRYTMNGACYSVDLSSYYNMLGPKIRATSHYPLSDPQKQLVHLNGNNYYDYGMGSAGFSLHMTPMRQSLLLGAPGVYLWTGASLLINDQSRNPDAAHVSDVARNLAFNYDDHFGYSVTSGYFYDTRTLYYASSAPRSNYMMGKVFIFSYTFGGMISIKKVFEGRQLGEFFGASLTSCDINNDGRDDLIIGAPNWSNDGDEGRIYAYISTAQRAFEMQTISGDVANARFGATVSCAGDLDLDGYADVAVGAPYEAGQGAVYVFNGGPEGLEKRPSQRIRGGDVRGDMRGFGASLAGAKDVDGNGYVDLAVGAYLSGHAVLFRSRPVVGLTILLRQSRNFTLNENTTSFNFDACVSFKGQRVPSSLKVNLTLKIDEFHKRAIVYQNGILYGNTFKIAATLVVGEWKCYSNRVLLKKKAVQNMIDPIEIAGSVGISDDPTCGVSCPVISGRLSRLSDNLKLSYALDCGSDGLCVSDLYVNVSTAGLGEDDSFVIGSRPQVNLTLLVGNSMAPAYKAQLHVRIPEPIALARIPTDCDEQSTLNATVTLVCNVGNPLRHNKTIVIELDMRGIRYTDETKTIQVEAKSQSEENDFSDNDKSLDIFYHVDADIGIVGKSDDSLYWYFEKDVRAKVFQNFTFKHVYEIQKFGISPIYEVTVLANVPTHWGDAEFAEVRQVEGSIDGLETYKCEDASDELNSTLSIPYDDSPAEESNDTAPALRANCAHPMVQCRTLRCAFGPFAKSLSVAKLTLTIDMRLNEDIAKAMEGKDTLFYASETIARITQPNVTIDAQNKRPDYKRIPTAFISRPEPEEVALWIIILSVLLGVVLLALIALVLYKLGFFNRKGAEDLDTLKSKEEVQLKEEGNDNSAVAVSENEQER